MVLIVIVTVGCRWWSLCVTVTERVTVRILQVFSEWFRRHYSEVLGRRHRDTSSLLSASVLSIYSSTVFTLRLY